MTDQDASGAVERSSSGETVLGFPVAAYRETHPEHGSKYGHRYSEHWSTPSTRDPRVQVERLFTEDQLRAALASNTRSKPSEQPDKALMPDAVVGEPVAYRYVHHDYAGRKVSRYGTHPERVNGHDPIEVHPLYAAPTPVEERANAATAEQVEALRQAAQNVLDRGYVSEHIEEERLDSLALKQAIAALEAGR